jgi:hypothetical protein
VSLEGVIYAFFMGYLLNGCSESQVIELLCDLDRITRTASRKAMPQAGFNVDRKAVMMVIVKGAAT